MQASKIIAAAARLHASANAAASSATKTHLKLTITPIPCDLGNPSTIETNLLKLLDQATNITAASNFTSPQDETQRTPLDHVIFCAGDPVDLSPLSSRSLATMQASGLIRFFAPILLAKHLPSYLASSSITTPPSHTTSAKLASHCSLTLTGGINSQRPIPGSSSCSWLFHSAYFAALEAATRSLAVDLSPSCVRVNLVSPGPVKTGAWSNVPEDPRDALKDLVTMGNKLKMAEPEEVAQAYLYCLRNTNATGSVVVSDGGVGIAA